MTDSAPASSPTPTKSDRKPAVLVLSIHSMLLDRRISAQMNALVETGRDVTLLSVPTVIPEGTVDPRCRVISPTPPRSNDSEGGNGDSQSQADSPPPDPLRVLKAIGRRLPGPLRTIAHRFYLRMRNRSAKADPHFVDFFDQLAPEGPFDVIHCHDLDTLPVAVALKKRRFPHAKLIYDSHELYPHQFHEVAKQRYWEKLERQTIGEADHVITVNASIADRMAETYGIDVPSVLFNSQEVVGARDRRDDEAFERHFGFERSNGSDVFRVIFQGSLTPDRNLEALIDSVEQCDRDLGLHLFVLGDGPLKDGLRRRVNTKGGVQQVHFGPAVSQSELPSFTLAADMGIIPYLGDELLNNHFCTPNKLFEFIEAEVPICASDLPELRRIVGGERIGAVYEMNGSGRIAASLSDCARRCKSGEFTRDSLAAAREKYSWDAQRRVLLSIYDELGL